MYLFPLLFSGWRPNPQLSLHCSEMHETDAPSRASLPCSYASFFNAHCSRQQCLFPSRELVHKTKKYEWVITFRQHTQIEAAFILTQRTAHQAWHIYVFGCGKLVLQDFFTIPRPLQWIHIQHFLGCNYFSHLVWSAFIINATNSTFSGPGYNGLSSRQIFWQFCLHSVYTTYLAVATRMCGSAPHTIFSGYLHNLWKYTSGTLLVTACCATPCWRRTFVLTMQADHHHPPLSARCQRSAEACMHAQHNWWRSDLDHRQLHFAFRTCRICVERAPEQHFAMWFKSCSSAHHASLRCTFNSRRLWLTRYWRHKTNQAERCSCATQKRFSYLGPSSQKTLQLVLSSNL